MEQAGGTPGGTFQATTGLIASWYRCDSEGEPQRASQGGPLGGPCNLVELPGDLLNGIFRMLSGRSSNWTEQDASPLGALPQLRLLRASCSKLKARVDGWAKVLVLLGTADQAMRGSVAVGGDLKRRIGVLVWLCLCSRTLCGGAV